MKHRRGRQIADYDPFMVVKRTGNDSRGCSRRGGDVFDRNRHWKTLWIRHLIRSVELKGPFTLVTTPVRNAEGFGAPAGTRVPTYLGLARVRGDLSFDREVERHGTRCLVPVEEVRKQANSQPPQSACMLPCRSRGPVAPGPADEVQLEFARQELCASVAEAPICIRIDDNGDDDVILFDTAGLQFLNQLCI